ncbi:Trk-type K+ transport system, membrane component [Pyrodictium delaneyi]|uniref:Trk-type K+ transport system, membrane component n=1 Tax=Pyrodictium delaneyi TaxID=1273541 RepID=A0A0P0N1G4_9CREN|nr:TrkH family potassium uptake protein [Pyrodictium delaneyi]ALL00394.1 Trk-type K+ transport system, membrane component [Pyrodictium delaneyi]OWJ53874.1 hypothetical protein Pdsh_08245 [Pyrodictium delaneyi]
MKSLRFTVHPLVKYMLPLSLVAAAAPLLLATVWSLLVGETDEYVLCLTIYSLVYSLIALIWLTVTKPTRPVKIGETLVLVAFAWILTPLLSAIPIHCALGIPFIDAWFESVSGFTTTGLSVFNGAVDPDYNVYIPSVEELPFVITTWRAVTQWLGGFGIVVMFYVFARLGGLPAHLVGFAEGRFERLEPSIAHSVRALFGLYVALTFFFTVLFYVSGMPANDALYHALTALSTGGFSSHSYSLGYYRTAIAVLLAAVLAMSIGAWNYADLYALLKGIPRKMSGEINAYIGVVAIGLVLSLVLVSGRLPVLDILFYVVSALSTTGFQVSSLSHAPAALKYVLVLLMFVGGSAFSTAGGVKLYRVMVLAKSVKWSSARIIYGSDYYVARKVGGTIVSEEEIVKVASVFFLFAILQAVGALLLLHLVPGTNLVDALFEATSALCTVGLSVGITGANLHMAPKLVLMALMTLGRLEIHTFILVPVLIVHSIREEVHHLAHGRYVGLS